MPYRFEWEVRAEDTDASGYLYTPSVVSTMTRGLEHLRDDIDYHPAKVIENEHILTPVVHVEVDYRSQVTWGDVVSVEMVPSFGDTSFSLDIEGETHSRTVFEGRLTCAVIDVETGESRPVPEHLREGFTRYIS